VAAERRRSATLEWPIASATLHLRRLLLGGLLAVTLAVPALAAAAPSVNVLKVLAGPIAKARRGGVPVLLPSRYAPGVARVYGSGGATGHGYALELDAAPDCHQATACFLALFTGARGRALGAPANVTLAGGVRGHYRATSCGASCSPGSLAWVLGGVRYEMQAVVVGPERAALVRLADAAIAAGGR
jgi:hypothetical protein